jgi:ABC-type transport system involved in multi-copper enzyme maturation permease subunit
MLNAYPVFRKDFRLLFKFMVGALAMQALVMVVAQLRPDQLLGGMRPQDWFPKMQIGVSAVMALVAAGYFLAEEREGKHDQFLYRLAASRKRIFTEKFVAGLAVVLLTLHLQFAWGLIGGRLIGNDVWAPLDTPEIVKVLIATTLAAYFISLPLSIFFRSTVGLIFTGICILSAAVILIHFPWDRYQLSPGSWRFFSRVAPIVLPLLVLILIGIARKTKTVAAASGGNTGLSLFHKQTRENLIIYAAIGLGLFAALGFTLAVPKMSRGDCNAVIVMIGFLSVLLGVSTYSRREKDGVSCILYHHPLSLSRLFWLKFSHGLVGAVLLDVALLMFVLRTFDISKEPPLAFSAFVLLCGLIPYCCGVLFTMGVRSSLYAMLAALLSLPLIALQLFLLNFASANVPAVILDEPAGLHPPLPWSPLFIVVGLVLGAWRTGTDRKAITERPTEKMSYVLRLYLFVVMAGFIVHKTGWRDLFYLITGIDLGSG